MVRVGRVLEVLDKSNPPYKKVVVLIEDLMNSKNKWAVEFRKHLYQAGVLLRPGDKVKFHSYDDGQIDSNKNHHNNIIAEKIERL